MQLPRYSALRAELKQPAPDLSAFSVFNLGRGGCSHGTYRVRSKRYGAVVAVKVAFKAEHLKHSKREYELLKGIRHPNIRNCFAKPSCRGNISWLVQEFAPGLDLGELLIDHTPPLPQRRHASMPPQLANCRYIATCVLRALYCLHVNSIVHNDLTLDNVIVNAANLVSPLPENTSVKLIDFGLACWEKDLPTRGFCGTPPYSAPEKSIGRSLDRSCDIFNYGILLYAILQSAFPYVWDRDTDPDKRYNIMCKGIATCRRQVQESDIGALAFMECKAVLLNTIRLEAMHRPSAAWLLSEFDFFNLEQPLHALP